MKTNPLPAPPQVFRGQTTTARYRKTGLDAYDGNPLIEALPPIVTANEALRLLTHYPPYREPDRELPAHLRIHAIDAALRFFQPLPQHSELEQRFARMLRGGYVARNPAEPGFWHDYRERLATVRGNPSRRIIPRSTADGFALIGMSGMGKSTGLHAVTQLYPQIIQHRVYNDRPMTITQVVWLKLDCPFDGSVKALCINFFQALDGLLGTDYRATYVRHSHTTDEMLPDMAMVGAVHHLGVLMVDEIQHLNAAKSGGSEKMLNFFCTLINMIGLPVILVGTHKAIPVLSGQFRQIRRSSGQGDLRWDRLENNGVWNLFAESLWHYQYTRIPTPWGAELGEALYDTSLGILDLAVKVYLLAQIRAITTGSERVTPALLHSVARDSFQLAQPFLRALRMGDMTALQKYDDVSPLDFDRIARKLRGTENMVIPVSTTGARSTAAPPAAPQTDETAAATAAADAEDGTPTAPRAAQARSPRPPTAEFTRPANEAPAPEDKLGDLVSKARAAGKPAYEALKDAGIIRRAGEE